jgi:hypothetical protein
MLPKAVPLMAGIATARFLGPGGFVLLVVAQSWASMGWSFADLGLNGYGVRATASLREDPDGRQRLLHEVTRIYLVSAVLVAAMVAALAIWLAAEPIVFIACLAYLPCYALYPDWFLRGTGSMGRLATSNWLAVVGPMVSLAIAALGGSLGLVALAWALGPAIPAATFWSARSRRTRAGGLQLRTRWRVHVRTSAKFALSGWLASLSVPLAVTLTAARAPGYEAAVYFLGLRVATAAGGVIWQFHQNTMHLLVNEMAGLRLRRIIATSCGIALLLAILGFVSWPVVARIAAVDGSFGFYAVGICLLLPLGLKMSSEALLIAGYRDWPRVAVGVAAVLMLTLLSIIGGVPVPLGLLLGESVAAFLALSLVTVAVHGRRSVQAKPPGPR